MAQLAAEHDLLVTVEEGVLAGGFGSAVWETLNDAGASPRILRMGLPDRFVTHGKPALLHEEVGYTAERIVERVTAAISDRNFEAGEPAEAIAESLATGDAGARRSSVRP
jgi:1-deoxy-D-xylulose-5-phosphate synthase